MLSRSMHNSSLHYATTITNAATHINCKCSYAQTKIGSSASLVGILKVNLVQIYKYGKSCPMWNICTLNNNSHIPHSPQVSLNQWIIWNFNALDHCPTLMCDLIIQVTWTFCKLLIQSLVFYMAHSTDSCKALEYSVQMAYWLAWRTYLPDQFLAILHPPNYEIKAMWQNLLRASPSEQAIAILPQGIHLC